MPLKCDWVLICVPKVTTLEIIFFNAFFERFNFAELRTLT